MKSRFLSGKKLLILLVSAITITAFAQDNPNHLNVLAVNGLNMRSQPDEKSRVVTKVPFGKRVEILKKTKVELQLGWIKNNWYLVRFRGREGYIFGGYLSKLSVPQNLETAKLISDLIPLYCASSFHVDGNQINSTEAGRSGDTLYHSLLRFNGGTELELEKQGDRRTSLLLIPCSVQDCYILLEALLKRSSYSEQLSGLRFVKGKNGELVRINNADGSISIRKLSNELVELKITAYQFTN